MYDSIQKYLYRYLLPTRYNHVDIGLLTLCELRRKCVILSNGGYKESNDTIITCSKDTPYLRRIRHSQMLRSTKSYKTPKLHLNSNQVRFFKDTKVIYKLMILILN